MLSNSSMHPLPPPLIIRGRLLMITFGHFTILSIPQLESRQAVAMTAQVAEEEEVVVSATAPVAVVDMAIMLREAMNCSCTEVSGYI